MTSRVILSIVIHRVSSTNQRARRVTIFINSHPSATANKAIHSLKRGLQNQREHHIILTKSKAVHPTAVSENNSENNNIKELSRFILF